MTHHDGVTSSLATSMITAFVALLPDYAISYGGKLLSVFILAVVAEAGRRLVNALWRKS